MTDLTSFALETRDRLPDELRYLAELYPREVWTGHANLGMTARFWLQRHDAFREQGKIMAAGLVDFREGRIEPRAFGPWLAPRLQRFLNELNGHHQIEDYQYFPVFTAAEPRLARGFELLDGDHQTIHHWIDTVAETANGFLRSLDGDRDALLRASDAYADASGAMLAGLMRHLADEEDLIIPLILDRTEDGIGI
ncbi:hemerythrin domain-containing protein [Kaistia granuli]|uniref:hemerythrin domain-containing protein n=1 Tax=Kaistia granuli TaxID=363259 RepID=UPI00037C0CC0|nr:hemerythrin domain-containing protein [Kaistia granuli]